MNNQLVLRLLKDEQEDYSLLYKWYKSKKVNTYFEQRALPYNEIVDKYSKRTSLDSITPVFMIEYQNTPIGIIQYTKLTDETKNKYHVSKDGYDIDIFIGEADYHNTEIGSNAIKLLIDKLKTKDNILTMVPETNNMAAIKCYEKVGFKKTYVYFQSDTVGVTKEKVVMVYDN